MNKTKCKICGKEIGNKGLTSHFKNTHNISSKEYYDKYLKQENEGKCLECGKETKFIKFTKGYRSFCSTKCLNNNEAVSKLKKESYLKKYGVDNPAKAEPVKNKMKQTNLERYGVENVYMREDLKQKSHSKESKLKEYQTKKKNNTFNSSKPEKKLELELKKIFSNLETQYKSELYPFKCDFYIPSLDLYIEYNGTWLHGGCFYDDNNEDNRNMLKMWKQRSEHSTFYKSAINVWTKSDLNKLNTALENNLNYVAWFNQEQAYDWINAYKESRTN